MSEAHILTVVVKDRDISADTSAFGLMPMSPIDLMVANAFCLEVDDRCRGYVECMDPACDRDELQRLAWDQGDSHPTLHGVVHQDVGRDILVPTDTCLIATSPDLWSCAEALVLERNLKTGTYLVLHTFEDDTGDLIQFTLRLEGGTAE